MRDHFSWWGALFLGLILETSVGVTLVPDGWQPDLTRALTLWVALTARPAGGPLYAFAAGAASDAFSGAPLGFGIINRLVLYYVVRPARGTIQHTRIVFLLGPFAVVLETLIVWSLRSMAFSNTVSSGTVLWIMMRQCLVEAVTVPIVFIVMELLTGYRAEREMRI